MNIQEVIKGLDQLFSNKESNKVEDYLSKNLEQALMEGDVGSAITIINELIGFYRDTSQYDKAEKYCKTLLPFMEKAGLKDTFHYGTSCLNIANVYRASGRLEDSLKHYQMVQSIYEKTLDKKDFHYASLYNNLSLLYQEMKAFDMATNFLNKALSIVKEYPEAIVELAVTYTNLAASYVKAGDIKNAQLASREGLAIFQNGLTEDYHYSAALSVAGDIFFAMQKYEQAAEYYEKAMQALKKHVGITHAYFRIISNLQFALKKVGKENVLDGLNLSKEYYNLFGKVEYDKYINKEDNKFKERGIELTFAKIGEGSECFGYDDILSKDHDFGPGFCIFISQKDYVLYGKELEEKYDKLPQSLHGFSKPNNIVGAPRNGVIILEDFFKRILSLDENEVEYLMKNSNLSDDVWLRIEDWKLKTVTNGEIFDGKDTLFSKIYDNLKKGYPEYVRRRKLAQVLGQICQEGQYNYQRMMQRQDLYGAIYLLQCFQHHVIEFLYLINRVYAPHEKWIMQEAKSLKKGQHILQIVQELMVTNPNLTNYQKRDVIEWIGKRNDDDKILIMIDQIANEIITLLKDENLTNSSDLYLENHIPYLLKKQE